MTREPELICFLHEWKTVAEVEAFCRSCYRVFDRLPSVVRIAFNCGDAYFDPASGVAHVLTMRDCSGCSNGRKLVALTRDTAMIETSTGTRQTYYRPFVEAGDIVLAWELIHRDH